MRLLMTCYDCKQRFFMALFDECPACSNLCGVCYACGKPLEMDHDCQELRDIQNHIESERIQQITDKLL